MKKIVLLLATVLSFACMQAQTLNSVSPNVALLGTKLTAQITGTGTLFQSSSPQGFFLEQGLTSIYASLATAIVTDDQNMSIEFMIPSGVPTGSYALQYSYHDTANASNIFSLSLANAVTITAPQLTISGIMFLDYNQNGIKDAGESGISGQSVLVTPDNQYFYSNTNGNYTIPCNTGNKTITWQSSAANYNISSGSQPSYTGNFVSTVSGYDFGLINSGPALVNITPDSVMAGTQLTAIISSTGTILQNGSPQGAINYNWIYNGTTYAGGSSITIINDTTHSSVFTFPITAAPGFYTLYVSYQDTSGANLQLALPNSVQVFAPEIYLEGYAFADRDSDAVRGFTEPGIGGQAITLQPDNQNFTTDGTGKYSLPTTTGNKTVSITPTGSYVVNPIAQSSISGNYISTTSGIDFPLLGPGPYLTACSPDTVLAGTTLPALISGYGTTFQSSSPPSSIIDAYLFRSNPSVTYYANSNTFSSIDDEHFTGDFTIPSNAPTGWYDLNVLYWSPSLTYVFVNLPNAVFVTQPQLFLEGNTYLDLNSNGIKDGGEPGIPNQKVKVQPDNVYSFSNSTGLYQVGSYPGTHTLTWDSSGVQFTLNAASPASYTQTVATTTAGFDFGLNSNLPPFECDLVSLYGTHRCNQNNYFYVSYQNTGLVTYDANIIIIKSLNTTFTAGALIPNQVNGDTITYNLTNLAPYQYGDFYFYIGMPAAGQNVSVTAIMQSLAAGVVQSTDAASGTTTVTCSYDPNDKEVTPAGVQSANFTLMNDTLQYLIRFQNTGNDTAFVVTIRDTIDSDLNLNSFRLIDASHPVQTQIDVATRIVTFTFNNILLVDSTTNEPLSHGYVRYSIKASNGLPNVTNIQNTAYIYFDYNDAVPTNTTQNTLVYSLPTSVPEIQPSSQPIVKVIPNPFTQQAYLVFENKDKNKYRLVIFSTQGKLVQDKIVSEENILVKKENLKSGLYLFKLIPVEKGSVLIGKFIIE